jgi:hypothetical protein
MGTNIPYSSGLPDFGARSTTEPPRAKAQRRIKTMMPRPENATSGPKKYEYELQAGTT